ncbi:hypothetical protein MLD38_002003 [Melastoma candidum]|uniref:Uncharacterized protein n=1 Tax=Melastoma candidum TaxID=119954 RepID=A0ACB9SEE2_9MYRT|nr:hypothetical protein MLD38_002003 [Melastoma candidum]
MLVRVLERKSWFYVQQRIVMRLCCWLSLDCFVKLVCRKPQVIEREKLRCRDMFLKSPEKELPSVNSARSKERASTAKGAQEEEGK